MKDKLQEITKRAMEQIDAAEEMSALNDVRVAVLGKKGELTAVLKSMKDVKPEDRPAVGQLVNETRSAIESALEEKKTKLEAEVARAKKMLSNPGFVSKAPESKINEEKEKLAKYEEMLKNTVERIKAL